MIAALHNFRRSNRRWVMTGLICLIILASLVDRFTMSIAIPSIREDLALTGLQVGMIFSAFQWSYAFSQVPAGLAVDRFGTRRVILVGAVIWTMVTAATGLASGLGVLILLRVMLGVSESPVFPSAIKVSNDWFPDKGKGRAIGMIEVVTKSGMVISPLIGALLITHFGWRMMFVILAVLSVVPVLLWLRHYRQPEEDALLTEQERAYIEQDERPPAPQGSLMRRWLGLFRHSQTWMLMLGGLMSASMIGLHNWIPTYLTSRWGFSVIQAGNSMAFLGAAGIAGALIGGLLSDALIRRGASVIGARKAVIVLSLVLASLTLFAATSTASAPLMLLALTVNSFGISLIYAPSWSLVPAIAPQGSLVASLGSLQNWGVAIGGGITPLVIGWLMDSGMDISLALSGCGIFALLGAVVYGLLIRSTIK